MFSSTKKIELGSCAFRQPRADSHCKYLHGYQLKAKFWFEAASLDINHWVVDFGGLKDFKKILHHQFDHTTCIAADDPELESFRRLHELGVCDLRVMPKGTGIERIAEWCYDAANKFIKEKTEGRCECVRVEVFEHDNNSAMFSAPTRTETTNIKQTELNFDKPVEEKPSQQPVQPAVTADPEMNKLEDRRLNTNKSKQVNTWVDKDAPKNSWRF